MRLLILPLCLALAGCLTSPDPAPSSEQQPPPAASDAAPAAQPRANQAARAASPKPTPTPPELDPQYTPEQRLLMIRQICWSQVDKNRGLKTVDARADWVDKCIADKRKQPLVQPASQ